MKVVLEEIMAGSENCDIQRQERAWKAFLLLPRLLLHRRCWGGQIGREKLKERFKAFRVVGQSVGIQHRTRCGGLHIGSQETTHAGSW